MDGGVVVWRHEVWRSGMDVWRHEGIEVRVYGGK